MGPPEEPPTEPEAVPFRATYLGQIEDPWVAEELQKLGGWLWNLLLEQHRLDFQIGRMLEALEKDLTLDKEILESVARQRRESDLDDVETYLGFLAEETAEALGGVLETFRRGLARAARMREDREPGAPGENDPIAG
jgi:hypothetical protein